MIPRGGSQLGDDLGRFGARHGVLAPYPQLKILGEVRIPAVDYRNVRRPRRAEQLPEDGNDALCALALHLPRDEVVEHVNDQDRLLRSHERHSLPQVSAQSIVDNIPTGPRLLDDALADSLIRALARLIGMPVLPWGRESIG